MLWTVNIRTVSKNASSISLVSEDKDERDTGHKSSERHGPWDSSPQEGLSAFYPLSICWSPPGNFCQIWSIVGSQDGFGDVRQKLAVSSVSRARLSAQHTNKRCASFRLLSLCGMRVTWVPVPVCPSAPCEGRNFLMPPQAWPVCFWVTLTAFLVASAGVLPRDSEMAPHTPDKPHC